MHFGEFGDHTTRNLGYIETNPSHHKLASNVSVVPNSDKKFTMQVNQYVPHFQRFPQTLALRPI